MMQKFLPLIVGALLITACGEALPSKTGRTPPDHGPRTHYTESCSDNEERASLENVEASQIEIEVACIIKNHPEQQRETMSYHPTLGEIARMRARDMAEHGYYGNPSHVDRHGYGPDWYMCEMGYETYEDQCLYVRLENPTANTVENIGWGSGDHANTHQWGMVLWWYGSPGHQNFMLALSEHISDYTYFGIGHAVSGTSTPTHYWVFISAPPPLSEQDSLE